MPYVPVGIKETKKKKKTIKIKTFESISSNASRDIAKSLKISFGSSFVNLRTFGSKWQFRFPVYTFQIKKSALDYFYPFLSFSVHNFRTRTDGRTDRKVFFFRPDDLYIHTCIYLSALFFKFHPYSDQT